MTEETAKKLIRELHGAGLAYPPDATLIRETVKTWQDVLGDLPDHEVENAVRAHLSGSEGQKWPAPAALRILANARRGYVPAAGGGCGACKDGGRLVVQLYRRKGRLVEERALCACSCLAGETWGRTVTAHHATGATVRHLRDLEQVLLRIRSVSVDSGEDGWIAWWVAPSRFATPTWTQRAAAELKAQIGKLGQASPEAIAAALAKLERGPAPLPARLGAGLGLSQPPTVEAIIQDADRRGYERPWQDADQDWAV